MRPMQWVRLWVMPHLDGDSCWKLLDFRQRGLFYSLLVLAGQSNRGGEISLPGTPGIAYTDAQLAAICHVTVQEFQETLKTIPADMVRRDLSQCLVVVSWSNYQTEYERQKGYRTKLHPRVTPQKSEVRSQKSEEQKSDKKEESAPASPDACDDSAKPTKPDPKPRALNVQALAVKSCLDVYLAGRVVIGQPYPGTPPPGPVVRWLGTQPLRDGAVRLFAQCVELAVKAHKLDPQFHNFPMTVPKFCARLPEINQAYLDAARRNAAKRQGLEPVTPAPVVTPAQRAANDAERQRRARQDECAAQLRFNQRKAGDCGGKPECDGCPQRETPGRDRRHGTTGGLKPAGEDK